MIFIYDLLLIYDLTTYDLLYNCLRLAVHFSPLEGIAVGVGTIFSSNDSYKEKFIVFLWEITRFL